jgi:mannose-6-phosphate isomerase-like protein (cupin superfamily)
MKHLLRAFLFAVTFVAAAGIVQAAAIVLPGDLKWTPGSGTSAGQMIAVIYGDPAKPGPFIIRVKSPDGFAIAAHYHAAVENVTVLQGTLLLGFGDKADKAKTTAIPAGGFYSIPKGVHHYAFAQGETILQIDSIGPRTKQRIEP